MNNILVNIFSFSFVVALIATTRQIPVNLYLSGLTIFSFVTFFFGFCATKLKYTNLLFFSIYIIIISFSGLVGILSENNVENILRFYIILMVVGGAVIIRPLSLRCLRVAKWFLIIQALVVISISLYMTFFGSAISGDIRHFFTSKNLGDIYSYDGIYYRVQILGNAILPLAFFISYINFRVYKGPISYFVLFSLSIFFCGNLTYIIGCAIFVFTIECLRSNINNLVYKSCSTGLVFFVLIIIFRHELSEIIDIKFSVDNSSMGIRFLQIEHLLSTFKDSYYSVLWGGGLGNFVDGRIADRVYSSAIYYELQWLYVLNQLGPILFLMLVLIHFIMFLSVVHNKYVVSAYILYIFSSITNPYLFDSSHFVVILILIGYDNYLKVTYVKQ